MQFDIPMCVGTYLSKLGRNIKRKIKNHCRHMLSRRKLLNVCSEKITLLALKSSSKTV